LVGLFLLWTVPKRTVRWICGRLRPALPMTPAFIVSAAILTVIQPPFGWAFLAWVAFVPFVLGCSPRGKAGPQMFAAYIVSAFYWMVSLYWVVPITIIGWVVFCLYTALLWPILVLGVRWCRGKNLPLFLALPVFIVGIEQMQGLFLGGFLWRLLGHSQYRNITIIQIADIFGAGGVSFLVGMVNGLAADLMMAARGGQLRRKRKFAIGQFARIAIVGGAVAGTILYGRWRIGQAGEFIEAGPLVASMQSNVPQSLKRAFKAEEAIFDDLMVHSQAAARAGAELIVWPETMVQGVLDEAIWPIYSDNAREVFQTLDTGLKEHAKDTAYILVGAYGAAVKQVGQEARYERYNSAYLYCPDGQRSKQRYDKIHLVPFGEVLPFRRSLPWVYNILRKFTPKELNYDYSLDYGSEYTVFEMGGAGGKTHKFAVIICYEDVVPCIGRRFALDDQGRKQVDWLVNISNDGWFVRFDDDSGQVHPSTELAQHAAICVFRAVENRLGIVRSVNTGISCLIDSFGNIHDEFAAGTLPSEAMARTGMAGWFADKMPIDKRITFFSKNGQWLDFCCKSCVFLFIIVSLLIRLFGAGRFGSDLPGRSNGKRVL
ncbi:MAG: apolipoprotein N-acyltransferase, partial [Sedimentisphaerales bacterium]|nr:apolipoprotein N-acyltransferase [Sedimentisphaerales bacterium]